MERKTNLDDLRRARDQLVEGGSSPPQPPSAEIAPEVAQTPPPVSERRNPPDDWPVVLFGLAVFFVPAAMMALAYAIGGSGAGCREHPSSGDQTAWFWLLAGSPLVAAGLTVAATAVHVARGGSPWGVLVGFVLAFLALILVAFIALIVGSIGCEV